MTTSEDASDLRRISQFVDRTRNATAYEGSRAVIIDAGRRPEPEA
jgi:hypothetical protein